MPVTNTTPPSLSILHQPNRWIGRIRIPEYWYYAGNKELLNCSKKVLLLTKRNRHAVSDEVVCQILDSLQKHQGVLVLIRLLPMGQFIVDEAIARGIPIIIVLHRFATSVQDYPEMFNSILEHNSLFINAVNVNRPANNAPVHSFMFASYLADAMIPINNALHGRKYRDLFYLPVNHERQIWLHGLPPSVTEEDKSKYLDGLRYYGKAQGAQLVGLGRLDQKIAEL